MSWAEETAALAAQVRDLRAAKTRVFQATVTAVDIAAHTFDVSITGELDGRDLKGIPAIPNHLPDVGDVADLMQVGAQVVHRTGKVTDALGVDPVDGTPQVTARFGQTVGTRSSVTGEQTSTGDEEGNYSVNSIWANSATVGGVDVSTMTSLNAHGNAVWFGSGKLQSNIVLEFGVAEVYFRAEPGRNYRVVFGGGLSSTVNNGEYVMRVRWTTDGSRPTSSSPILAERWQSHMVGARWQDWQWSQFFQRDENDPLDIHLLLTIARGTGQTTGTVGTTGTPPFLQVDDLGVYRVASGTAANDGSGSAGLPPQQYNVYEATAAWSRSFRGDGTIRSDTTDMVQGWDPSGFNGDGKAMVGWPDLTSMLSGASIRSVKLFLQNYHWYYSAGGTLLLGTHSQTAAPGSFSGTTNRIQVGFGPEPSQQWIDVTGWASEIKAGTTRGFTIGPGGGSNMTYYGRFAGAADTAHTDLRPRLQIVYYK